MIRGDEEAYWNEYRQRWEGRMKLNLENNTVECEWAGVTLWEDIQHAASTGTVRRQFVRADGKVFLSEPFNMSYEDLRDLRHAINWQEEDSHE